MCKVGLLFCELETVGEKGGFSLYIQQRTFKIKQKDSFNKVKTNILLP